MAEQVGSTPGTSTGSDYLAQRQLKAGSASWVLLAGLGVAYVISGDYAGWHFGLAQGGWGGLAVAAVLLAVMYACMVLGLAEMSSALPAAGGGYTFARVAMGPWGGFATGAAILLEYAVAPAAIATFIAATSSRSACSGSPTAGGSTSPATCSSSASTCPGWARRSRPRSSSPPSPWSA